MKIPKKHYSCDKYQKFYKEQKNQQFQAYQYATKLADSLSQVEYPCFEYEATFGCMTGLWQKANKFINPTEDCVIMREPHSEPCYEYSINITKKRRSKIKLSTDESTVFCPEEFYRQ